MFISFMQSELLNKKLETYYLNENVYDYLVNKVQGYKDGDEDPYVLLQMGADLANELCDSDGFSNGNKIWHLRCDGDNWFIPAKDEKEVREFLKKLLPKTVSPERKKKETPLSEFLKLELNNDDEMLAVVSVHQAKNLTSLIRQEKSKYILDDRFDEDDSFVADDDSISVEPGDGGGYLVALYGPNNPETRTKFRETCRERSWNIDWPDELFR